MGIKQACGLHCSILLSPYQHSVRHSRIPVGVQTIILVYLTLSALYKSMSASPQPMLLVVLLVPGVLSDAQ